MAFSRPVRRDVATLTEAFRPAVLRLFVRRALMDVETALDWILGVE